MSTQEPDGTAPAAPPSPVQRVVRVVTAIEVGIAALALAMIFVLVLVQAGQRYLPIDGWTWTGELARYGLVWVTFTATGVLVTRDGHIALQLVDELKSEMLVRGVHVFALAVVAVTGAGFAWACWSLMQDSGSLTTPSLGLPMKYVYVLPLLGFVSTAVRATVAAVLIARRGVAPADHSGELDIQVNGPMGSGTGGAA